MTAAAAAVAATTAAMAATGWKHRRAHLRESKAGHRGQAPHETTADHPGLDRHASLHGPDRDQRCNPRPSRRRRRHTVRNSRSPGRHIHNLGPRPTAQPPSINPAARAKPPIAPIRVALNFTSLLIWRPLQARFASHPTPSAQTQRHLNL